MKRLSLAVLALMLSSAGCVPGVRLYRFAGYVTANGVHTYYERYGNGPPLVLLHGAAMVTEAWRPQIEAFSRHFTVYVPERRGENASI